MFVILIYVIFFSSIQIPVVYERELLHIEGDRHTIAGDIVLEVKERKGLTGDYVVMDGDVEVC